MARWARRLSGGKKTGPNPTDRGKCGGKRSVAIEGHGVPIGLVVAPANVNDCKLLEQTLTQLAARRPEPTPQHPQNVCLDKGFDFRFVEEVLTLLAFVGHIRRLGEETHAVARDPAPPPRRWKIERTGSWFNRFRGVLIRWCKKPVNHLAFCQAAAAVITLRMAYGLADCQFG
jgi:putative transposase